MKKFLIKSVIIIALFALSYGVVMIVAYDYLYPYPKGFLDDLERADEARYYALVHKVKIDKDTLLYFTKSKNGVGADLHFGTLDCSKPDIIANFFCESTSSVYMPCDTLSYTVTSDSSQTCYLFGATQDENTVRISVTFIKDENNKITYELIFENQCYYYKGFDSSWAQYPFVMTGHNSEGFITFELYGEPFEMNQPAKINR
ncbi:MAG: hypothetical protein QM204_00070 [Bacillota bacterium]|jgi:hypothetical protein|nr:hypothetical protein [Bacillota bacterium]NLL26732.1 hypothetical protein [Erysipelotrichia bacterium]